MKRGLGRHAVLLCWSVGGAIALIVGSTIWYVLFASATVVYPDGPIAQVRLPHGFKNVPGAESPIVMRATDRYMSIHIGLASTPEDIDLLTRAINGSKSSSEAFHGTVIIGRQSWQLQVADDKSTFLAHTTFDDALVLLAASGYWGQWSEAEVERCLEGIVWRTD